MVKLLAGRAPAKINLYLRITGRRLDGYHEIDSVLVPISIFDRIRIEVRPAPYPLVSLRCSLPEIASVGSNLAARAAADFMAEFGLTAQVTVDLEKRIPLGAGLGGGSSDAGTVIRMLAEIERIEDRDRLAKIALDLGADVPFFLSPGPARVSGIGEKISPLGGMAPLILVIAVPPVPVSTARVYGAVREENFSGRAAPGDLHAIRSGDFLTAVTINDLAAAAVDLYPEIARLMRLVEDSGGRAWSMTGSGGGVYGVYSSPEQAVAAASWIARRAPEARVMTARSLGPDEASA